MQEIILYLLKSSGLLVLFFCMYYFLLQKETFFTYNRWFLLFGLLTSAILPLLYFKKTIWVAPIKLNTNYSSNLNLNYNNTKEIIQQSSTIDWLQLGFYVYILIAIILFFKIIYNLFSVIKIIRNKKIIEVKNFKIINTNQNIEPFSFFNYIVLNSSFYTLAELQNIVLHEKIHSKQKHSIDVLITHLFAVVFWFNPILYWYKKAVYQNLEYIADSEAIAQIEDKKSYQLTLLKVISNQNCLPISNHFYQSLIKKRIVMLNKNQSHKRNSLKYAILLPALIGFVLLFQIKVIAQEKQLKSQKDKVDKTAVAVLVGENYMIFKKTSDKELKEDAALLKKENNIDCTYGTILRNEENEIIAIEVSYKNSKGQV